MTDLQFFISLWERMGTKYCKVDENNAFVTFIEKFLPKSWGITLRLFGILISGRREPVEWDILLLVGKGVANSLFF